MVDQFANEYVRKKSFFLFVSLCGSNCNHTKWKCLKFRKLNGCRCKSVLARRIAVLMIYDKPFLVHPMCIMSHFRLNILLFFIELTFLLHFHYLLCTLCYSRLRLYTASKNIRKWIWSIHQFHRVHCTHTLKLKMERMKRTASNWNTYMKFLIEFDDLIKIALASEIRSTQRAHTHIQTIPCAFDRKTKLGKSIETNRWYVATIWFKPI